MKYHSHKVDTPDGVFDSKKEYYRWIELKEMQERGLISELNRQVVYELLPKQYYRGKFAEHRLTYRADFTYTQNGETIVEDVKGFKTTEYRLKRKLFLHIMGFPIKEV